MEEEGSWGGREEEDGGEEGGEKKPNWLVLSLILSAGTILDVSTYTIQVPLLPELKENVFQNNHLFISSYYYSFAVSSLFGLFALPFVGRFIRYKKMIVFSQLIFIPSLFLLWFGEEMWSYFLARICQGICSSVYWASATACLFHLLSKDQYPKGFSYLVAGESIGFMIGPFFGGTLKEDSFLLVAVSSSLLLLPILYYVPMGETIIDPSLSWKDVVKITGESMLIPKCLLIYWTIFLASGSTALNELCISFFYHETFELSAAGIGYTMLGYGIAYGIGALFSGHITKNISCPVQLIFSLMFFSLVFSFLVGGFFEISFGVSAVLLVFLGFFFGIACTVSGVTLSNSLEESKKHEQKHSLDTGIEELDQIEEASWDQGKEKELVGVGDEGEDVISLHDFKGGNSHQEQTSRSDISDQSVVVLRLIAYFIWWYGGWAFGPILGSVTRCDLKPNIFFDYQILGLLNLVTVVLIAFIYGK